MDAIDDYFVSGIIINDPNGPRRWYGFFEANSPLQAEEMAKATVYSEVVEGMHGILLVANVLQLVYDSGGKPSIEAVDNAVYADDPLRPDGYELEGGWTPPVGFEGYEGNYG